MVAWLGREQVKDEQKVVASGRLEAAMQLKNPKELKAAIDNCLTHCAAFGRTRGFLLLDRL